MGWSGSRTFILTCVSIVGCQKLSEQGNGGLCTEGSLRAPPSQSVRCQYQSCPPRAGHGVARKGKEKRELFQVDSTAKLSTAVSCRGRRPCPTFSSLSPTTACFLVIGAAVMLILFSSSSAPHQSLTSHRTSLHSGDMCCGLRGSERGAPSA